MSLFSLSTWSIFWAGWVKGWLWWSQWIFCQSQILWQTFYRVGASGYVTLGSGFGACWDRGLGTWTRAWQFTCCVSGFRGDHQIVRQPRQLPMVPSASINKNLVNQRSLPEDFSDAYLRETYSSKFTTYLRKAIADRLEVHLQLQQ